jgi:type IV pilus assembly protein PilP
MIIKRLGRGRLKAANRIGMILIASIAMVFLGCEGNKTAPKEPVVTKQIATSTIADKKPSKSIETDQADSVNASSPSAIVANNSTNKRKPYNPIGKVDPFAPLYKEEAKKPEKVVVKQKEPERPRTPLEKLDLAQLKLTAIVTTEDQKRALVEEASGKGYVVEIGTKIGLERGSVVSIDQDRIIIEHQAENDFGKTTISKRELKLQKPPGD